MMGRLKYKVEAAVCMRNITLSSHSVSQFSRRLCINSFDSIVKMREILNCCEEVGREEAYDLIQYEQILNKRNRYNKYYAIDFDNEDVLALFKDEQDYHLDLRPITGVFIVKDNTCVTFKTNRDHEIWDSRPKGHFSSKFLDRKQNEYLASQSTT